MGKHFLFSTLAAVAVVALASACAGDAADPREGDNSPSPQLVGKPELPKGAAMYVDSTPDYSRPLRSSDNTSLGSLRVYNDTQQVFVSYDLDGHLAMASAEVYVGTTPPASTDDPTGFPYTETFSQAMNTYTFYLPVSDLGSLSTLYVAAHAVTTAGVELWAGELGSFSGLTEPTGFETGEMSLAPEGIDPAAAADATQTLESGAAIVEGGQSDPAVHYFAVPVMPVFTPVPDWHGFTAVTGNAGSTWGIDFAGTDWLPVPDEPVWVGWCVDQAHSMYTGIEYQIQLYSCYDPQLPPFAESNNWDMISYLITQRNNNHTAPYNVNWDLGSSVEDFQEAIWYFKGGGGMPAQGTLAYRLVQDALKNGDGFIPVAGEFQAGILHPDTTTNDPTERAQMNIVEVEIFHTF